MKVVVEKVEVEDNEKMDGNEEKRRYERNGTEYVLIVCSSHAVHGIISSGRPAPIPFHPTPTPIPISRIVHRSVCSVMQFVLLLL